MFRSVWPPVRKEYDQGQDLVRSTGAFLFLIPGVAVMSPPLSSAGTRCCVVRPL